MVNKKSKLNNLHIIALFFFRHGPALASKARQALYEQRFGRKMSERDSGFYCEYFVGGSPRRQWHRYSGPNSKKQLWYKRSDRRWFLTPLGLKKAREAMDIITAETGVRVGSVAGHVK